MNAGTKYRRISLNIYEEGIMDIEYRWTDGSNEDFRCFYKKTEEYYCEIVGGISNRSGFVP